MKRHTRPVWSLVMDLRLLRYFVAVVDERHVGRAAERLHMTQPPLSRAVRQLEQQLGTALLVRTSAGVEPTPAGELLHREARSLLAHAAEVQARVTGAAGGPVLRLGTLADSAVRAGPDIAARFHARNPGVRVAIHEADFGDPSAGLRRGLVDVALTRLPFDTAGLRVLRLRADRVGIVSRADDPLARAGELTVDAIDGRRVSRFPDGTDEIWQAYWSGGRPVDPQAPAIRTANEFFQFVLWNLGIGLAPIDVRLPDGLAVTPVRDAEPSWLALVWRDDGAGPLIEEFARAAAEVFAERVGGPSGGSRSA